MAMSREFALGSADLGYPRCSCFPKCPLNQRGYPKELTPTPLRDAESSRFSTLRTHRINPPRPDVLEPGWSDEGLRHHGTLTSPEIRSSTVTSSVAEIETVDPGEGGVIQGRSRRTRYVCVTGSKRRRLVA